MLIVANAGKRRKARRSSSRIADPGAGINVDVGVALSKKQKSKWQSKQVFERNCSRWIGESRCFRVCHNAALLFHQETAAGALTHNSTQMIEELRRKPKFKRSFLYVKIHICIISDVRESF
jgi:hypothetical protein